jgi:hypothetical protein
MSLRKDAFYDGTLVRFEDGAEARMSLGDGLRFLENLYREGWKINEPEDNESRQSDRAQPR